MNLGEYARREADDRVVRLKENYDSKDLIWLAGFVDYWESKGYDVRKYARFVDGYQTQFEFEWEDDGR
ncbi:hypothetical protein HYT52_01695 [Candidatus Woesearchaeota archaeon]|nr:hypothetical protein [Candidatus Woesearchaeota archaeon]